MSLFTTCWTHATVMHLGICIFLFTFASRSGASEPDKRLRCPTGWTPFADACYKVNPLHRTWQDARDECQKEAGDLVSIRNQIDNAMAVNLAGNHTPFWIGLKEVVETREPGEDDGEFFWTDGRKLTFNNWAPEEPDGYGACVRVPETGQWKTTDCSQEHKMVSVCKKKQHHGDQEDSPCSSGWTAYHRACYKLNTVRYTWEVARDHCQNEAADLVSLNTSDENDWVYNLARNNTPFWIGLKQKFTSLRDADADYVDFAWRDGEPFVFNNWAPGEPDRYGACVRVDETGHWKTTDCRDQYKMASVCKSAKLAEFNPCLQQPCLNGGTCLVAGRQNFRCSCGLDFKGGFCQDQIDQSGSLLPFRTGVEVTWPSGLYALPRPPSGCPEPGREWYLIRIIYRPNVPGFNVSFSATSNIWRQYNGNDVTLGYCVHRPGEESSQWNSASDEGSVGVRDSSESRNGASGSVSWESSDQETTTAVVTSQLTSRQTSQRNNTAPVTPHVLVSFTRRFGKESSEQAKENGEEVGWPAGKYCVLHVIGVCPKGLTRGTYVIDGHFTIANDPANPEQLPQGTLGWASLTSYCCQKDGDHNQPIRLPTDGDFYLFPLDGTRCQQVEGMTSSSEYVYLTSNDSFNVHEKRGDHPYFDFFDNGRIFKYFLCYYRPSGQTDLLDGPTESGSTVNTTPRKVKIIVSTSSVLLLVAAIVLACIYKHRRRTWLWLGNSSSRWTNKPHLGDMNLGTVVSNEFYQTQNNELQKPETKLGCLLSSILDQDMKLRLEKLWMSRTAITLAEQVGKGAFGTVWKAHHQTTGRYVKAKVVAVKCIQETCSNEDIIQILTEALVMGDLRHRHVLGLLGVATDDELGLPLLVLPFMDHGDLHSYLRNFRFGDLVDVQPPTPHQLLVFGQHIARGMEYLSDQHIVHRDLACRNCMLDVHLVVKVADFGLAKDVYETSYYRQIKESRLPIKWLAVESLTDRVFTSHSDVWAYGVTLWEIYTLGRTPYPSLGNSQVLKYVENGGRLDQPSNCPDRIFSLMADCWSVRPTDRPTFSELAERIEQYLGAELGYLQLNDLGDPETDNSYESPVGDRQEVTSVTC